jgi:hypothetical protein
MADQHPTRDNRWWEHYALRYLVPTMTGMLLLRWLQLNTKGFFSHMLPPAGTLSNAAYTFEKISTAELLIWMGSGFTFAYIASLPILAFHASRSIDANPKLHRAFRALSEPLPATFLLVASTAALVAVKHVQALQALVEGCDWQFAALLPVAFFSFVQAIRLWRVGREESMAASFAERLATARSTAATSSLLARANDYVTSYRHLREHGNVAFIVILQIALTALLHLLLTGNPTKPSWDWDDVPGAQWLTYGACLLLLIIWVAPSVGVYHLSQKLERRQTRGSDLSGQRLIDKLVICPVRSTKSSRDSTSVEEPPSSPAPAERLSGKRLFRTLRALSQFSPWLLPLAFCPPILLLWTHVSNLHHPALLLPAISSTAGLGTLLLLGGLVWLAWLLSLATPSLIVALITSLYGRGNAPPSFAWTWTAAGILVALCASIATQSSAIFVANAIIALIPAACVLISPPPLTKASHKNTLLAERLWTATGTAVLGFFALTFLLFPLFLFGQALGKPPQEVGPLVKVAFATCALALTPGVLYAFLNSRVGGKPRTRMSITTFACVLLIPPLLTAVVLSSAKAQFIYTTLAAAGVVDSFAEKARPGLYRLPEGWTEHDRQLTSGFPKDTTCLDGLSVSPLQSRWICGYRNFSFGTTQLICDQPYVNSVGDYTKEPLTCITFVANQLIGYNILRPRGNDRSE